MKKNDIKMTDELLAAYLEGNVTKEEMQVVLKNIASDPVLREMVQVVSRVDEHMAEMEDKVTPVYPIYAAAAAGDGNLCDIQCEQYILSVRGFEIAKEELTSDAQVNKWLKDEGTPLYNVGRLLEKNGMTVHRCYECSIGHLAELLHNMEDVIVVVNNDKLTDQEAVSSNPNHAVVVLDVNEKIDLVRIFNPASLCQKESYTISEFMNAWADSNNYVVSAQPLNAEYRPAPFNLSDVILDYDFVELRESIAENAHENWAALRQKEGWTYGKERNDKTKQTPDMVPYSKLSESEKDYDRNLAMETIKLVKKLGYETVKVQHTPAFTLLMHRISELDGNECTCSACGHPIFKGQVYCEQCGSKLVNEEFNN